MTKAKFNLIIDALLLLCLAALAGIGLLIKYVLVPGFQRWEIYGQNVELFFRGLDRHEWGTIHYSIGLAFLILLVLHVVLHWGIIVRIWRNLVPNRPARWIAAAVLVGLTIFLLAFSFFVRPTVRQLGRGKGRGEHQHKMRGLQMQRGLDPCALCEPGGTGQSAAVAPPGTPRALVRPRKQGRPAGQARRPILLTAPPGAAYNLEHDHHDPFSPTFQTPGRRGDTAGRRRRALRRHDHRAGKHAG